LRLARLGARLARLGARLARLGVQPPHLARRPPYRLENNGFWGPPHLGWIYPLWV